MKIPPTSNCFEREVNQKKIVQRNQREKENAWPKDATERLWCCIFLLRKISLCAVSAVEAGDINFNDQKFLQCHTNYLQNVSRSLIPIAFTPPSFLSISIFRYVSVKNELRNRKHQKPYFFCKSTYVYVYIYVFQLLLLPELLAKLVLLLSLLLFWHRSLTTTVHYSGILQICVFQLLNVQFAGEQ